MYMNYNVSLFIHKYVLYSKCEEIECSTLYHYSFRKGAGFQAVGLP